jgi:hypothetical protein
MASKTDILLKVSVESIETLRATIKTTNDPTGTAPAFAFSALSDMDPTDDWNNGSWGTWNSSSKVADAVSPTFPDTTATVSLSVGTYNIWMKWTVGSETPIKLLGRVVVF